MELTGNQKSELREALLEAFTAPIKLQRMLVEKDLQKFQYFNGDNLNEIIFNLIQEVESCGKIKELIFCAYEYSPDSPKLKAFVENLKKPKNLSCQIKPGSVIKIYPVIATDSIDEENAKDASKIPICIRLFCQNEQYYPTPNTSGSLKDLHEKLKKFFEKHERDTGVKFELDLTKHFVRSLNTIIEEYDFLDKYEKIVICCPLHYIHYKNYSSKFAPQNKEGNLIKLIYQIDYETELSSKILLYSELREFYREYIGSYQREQAKIDIYVDVHSAAARWFHYVKTYTYYEKHKQPIDEPTY